MTTSLRICVLLGKLSKGVREINWKRTLKVLKRREVKREWCRQWLCWMLHIFSLQLLFITVRNCMDESKIKKIGVGIMDAYVKDFPFLSMPHTQSRQWLAQWRPELGVHCVSELTPRKMLNREGTVSHRFWHCTLQVLIKQCLLLLLK